MSGTNLYRVRLLKKQYRSPEFLRLALQTLQQNEIPRKTDALERWGRVDVVVHNAGIGGGTGGFEDVRDDSMDAVFKTHLYGAFHVLRPAWRVMKERGYGRIVNTSSSTALGVDGSFDYPAAKAGLIGLSRSLAREGSAFGIKVNAIMPLAYTRMAAGVPNAEI